jgi:hypothetical protein
LRERLRKGDADLAPEEIEAAIEKARSKLADLQRTRATAMAMCGYLRSSPPQRKRSGDRSASGLDGGSD